MDCVFQCTDCTVRALSEMKMDKFLNRPVTQKVIAKHSGVSTSLVSRILSGRLEKAIVVSAEKEFRVRRVAEELGYRGLS